MYSPLWREFSGQVSSHALGSVITEMLAGPGELDWSDGVDEADSNVEYVGPDGLAA